MGFLLSRLRLIYQTLKSISDSFFRPLGAHLAGPWTPWPELLSLLLVFPPFAFGYDSSTGAQFPEYAAALRVVMLEARDVCSGATGRNGGHVSPNTYQDYAELEAKYGERAAQAIIRFRLAHLPALLAVAEKENLLSESQTREFEQFDVFLSDTLYQRAKDALARYLTALPERRGTHKTHEDTSTLEGFHLSSQTAGCISQPGGAIHPYRLITGILARLVTYPNFQLLTNTPCTNIAQAVDRRSYVITTPKGSFTAAHVVNAWTSHLLPGMRRKIVPIRVRMTTQRPGRSLGKAGNASSWAGTRAFVFYPWTSMLVFDYLDDQSPASCTAGELMFGGGAMLGGRAEATMMDNIGITDDSESDFEVSAYLGGALERYFAPGWGEEGTTSAPPGQNADAEAHAWSAGRVKAAWSGIMGLSADVQPWVRRVPQCISKRAEPETPSADTSLARPGEWIAAGFTGEGMTHAWLAGVALANMLLGRESVPDDDASALPPQFLITEKRWKEADIEAFLAATGVQ